MIFVVLVLALGGIAAGMILLEDSWLQLLLAGGLGVIFTQFAVLGHEASHCQIFESGQANERTRAGRRVSGHQLQLVDEQTQSTPCQPEQDRQGSRTSSPTPCLFWKRAPRSRGRIGLDYQVPSLPILPAAAARRAQLACQSIRSLGSRTPVKGRWIELGMLAARFMIYFGLIFWLLPFGMAWAFIGVQLDVFGLYMGATFSPNHKGIPVSGTPVRGSSLGQRARSGVTAVPCGQVGSP